MNISLIFLEKYYEGLGKEEPFHFHTPSHSRPLPPACHNYTYANFTTFPAFSSNQHLPHFSFFNFTNFNPSLYCNFPNFPHLPHFSTHPFSFNFATFPFYHNSTYTDAEDGTCDARANYTHAHAEDPHAHTLQSHMEHAMRTKAEELKKFLGECRDHLKLKMHSFHDSLGILIIL